MSSSSSRLSFFFSSSPSATYCRCAGGGPSSPRRPFFAAPAGCGAEGPLDGGLEGGGEGWTGGRCVESFLLLCVRRSSIVVVAFPRLLPALAVSDLHRETYVKQSLCPSAFSVARGSFFQFSLSILSSSVPHDENWKLDNYFVVVLSSPSLPCCRYNRPVVAIISHIKQLAMFERSCFAPD